MNKTKLNQLIVNVRAQVERGHSLDLSIRAEVFAFELSPQDEQQLRDAVARSQPPIREQEE